jgi:hypothetical protein
MDVRFFEYILFCVSFERDYFQPFRLDVEKNEIGQPDRNPLNSTFLDNPGNMVWFWLLPLHGLALAGAREIRIFGFALFLHEVSY